MTKVVLRTDVARVGKKGDILEVADGYARNFLIPKGKAIVASGRRGRPGLRHAPLAGPQGRPGP